MRKICVVTGTRAEYGLMHWVMQGIKDAPELTLKIIATGMSVLPEFGLTYREIEQGGFQADRFHRCPERIATRSDRGTR